MRSSDPARPAGLDGSDEELVRALRGGDEQVFCELVERWSSIMLRLALSHVGSRAVAEDVVQDAWLTVLRSLDRFERRSAFRTWVLGIVVNVARSRARAERRSVPLPAESDDFSVDPARFRPAGDPRWPHHWAVPPTPWNTPEEDLLAGETRTMILHSIDALPATQREVLVSRDIEGFSAEDVCQVLQLSAANQRVLLHRARSRVRLAIERYFAGRERS